MKTFKIIISLMFGIILLGTLKAGLAESKTPFLEPRNSKEQFIYITNGIESMIVCPVAKEPLNCIDKNNNSVTKEQFIKQNGFKSLINFKTIVLNDNLYYLMKVLNQ